MAIIRVLSDETFQAEYPRVREWLCKAIERNTTGLTEQAVVEGVIESDYQLWTSPNAVCVSSIIPDWNGKTVCCLILIGGKSGAAIREIFEVGMPVLEEFALSKGCEGMLGIGRDGWKKLVVNYGFEVDGNNYYREISK